MLSFSQMDRMVGKNRRTFKTLQILVLCFFLLFPFFFSFVWISGEEVLKTSEDSVDSLFSS